MFAKDIAYYLEEKEIGTVMQDIFIENMPSKLGLADNAVGVYTSPSYALRYKDVDTLEYSCAIRVRGTDVVATGEKATRIYNLICNKQLTFTNAGGRKFITRPSPPPYFLEIDVNKRVIYVLNITCLTARYS